MGKGVRRTFCLRAGRGILVSECDCSCKDDVQMVVVQKLEIIPVENRGTPTSAAYALDSGRYSQ